MAEIAEELVVRITAEIGQAVAAFKDIAAQAVNTGKATTGLFDSMAGGAQKMYFLAQSVQMVARGVESFLGEAFAGEQAAFRIGYALDQAGQGGEEAKKKIADLATSIQMQMGIADDAVQEVAAGLVNQGRSVEETTKIIKTANDMAAAGRGEFADLAQKIGLSYEGVDARLSRIAPQIKGLTEEQMRAGVAADILAGKFAGAADKASKLASVKWQVNKEKINNTLEELGNASIDAVDYFAASAEAFARDVTGIASSVAEMVGLSKTATQAGAAYAAELAKVRDTRVTSDTGQARTAGEMQDLIEKVTTLSATWDDLRLSEKTRAQLAKIPKFAEWEAINQKIKTTFPDAKTITVYIRTQALAFDPVANRARVEAEIAARNANAAAVAGATNADAAAQFKALSDMYGQAAAAADAVRTADGFVKQFWADVNGASLSPLVRDVAALDQALDAAFTKAGVVDQAQVAQVRAMMKNGEDMTAVIQSILDDKANFGAGAAALVKMLTSYQTALETAGGKDAIRAKLQATIESVKKNTVLSKKMIDAQVEQLQTMIDALDKTKSYAEGAKSTDVGRMFTKSEDGSNGVMNMFTNALFDAAMKSESFAQAMNIITTVAGRVVEILDPIIENLLGPIMAALDPLAVALAAVAQVVILLDPAFELLGGALKILAEGILFVYNKVIRPVANGIIKIFNAIFSAIDAIPFVSFGYRIKELSEISFNTSNSTTALNEATEILEESVKTLTKEYDRQKTKVNDLYNAQVDSAKKLYELGLIGMGEYIRQIDTYAEQRDDALTQLAAQFEPQLAALKSIQEAVENGNKEVADSVIKSGGDIALLLGKSLEITQFSTWSKEDTEFRKNFQWFIDNWNTTAVQQSDLVGYYGVTFDKFVQGLEDLYAKYGMEYTGPTVAPTVTVPTYNGITQATNPYARSAASPVVVNIYNSGSVIAENDLAKTVTSAVNRAVRRGVA